MSFNRLQLSQDDWVSNLKNNPGLSLLLVNGFHDLVLLHNVSILKRIYSVPSQICYDCLAVIPRLKAETVNFLAASEQNPSADHGKI